MNYPLQLSFKLFAFTKQVSVTEANGHLLFYVKQKAFSWKDAVTVFADEAQTQPYFRINADKALDWSARFYFTANNGQTIGSVKRHGGRSLWRAHYDIYDGEAVVASIREENPWTKVFDALFAEIPVVGMFTGYVFNPSYIVTWSNGAPVMRLKKLGSFFGRSFSIEKLAELDPQSEQRVILSLLMMTLLERRRG